MLSCLARKARSLSFTAAAVFVVASWLDYYILSRKKLAMYGLNEAEKRDEQKCCKMYLEFFSLSFLVVVVVVDCLDFFLARAHTILLEILCSINIFSMDIIQPSVF